MPSKLPTELHADLRCATSFLVHDLNNALTLLEAGVEAAGEGESVDEDTQEDLNLGLAGVQRIGRKLQLLSGRPSLRAEVVGLAQAVEDALEALEAPIDDVELELDRLPSVRLDPLAVEDLLHELFKVCANLGLEDCGIAVREVAGQACLRLSFAAPDPSVFDEGSRVHVLAMMVLGWAAGGGGEASFSAEAGRLAMEARMASV
ncbi:MAG: hypothetical protein KC731_25430 [Myxococcales bacterium]|nr:hypothetical protein [Myxococcales bacterium]